MKKRIRDKLGLTIKESQNGFRRGRSRYSESSFWEKSELKQEFVLFSLSLGWSHIKKRMQKYGSKKAKYDYK